VFNQARPDTRDRHGYRRAGRVAARRLDPNETGQAVEYRVGRAFVGAGIQTIYGGTLEIVRATGRKPTSPCYTVFVLHGKLG